MTVGTGLSFVDPCGVASKQIGAFVVGVIGVKRDERMVAFDVGG